jgi:hypothetical protein
MKNSQLFIKHHGPDLMLSDIIFFMYFQALFCTITRFLADLAAAAGRQMKTGQLAL